MLVTIIQSGGVTGIRYGLSLNTDDLPAEAAAEIYQLVADCDFFSLPRSIHFNDGRDGFLYTVSVTSDEQSHEIIFNPSAISVPDELKRLIVLASQHAKMTPLGWSR